MKSSDPGRPTLKSIARVTGLSVAAVSFALRNHPSIPARTCARVQKAAARLNYTQDPELTKLMSYLRRARLRRKVSVLGLITLFPEPAPWRTIPHLEKIHRAARARAERLGFDLKEFWLMEPGMTAARLRDVLLARGIEGLVLLGAPRWVEHLDFDFSSFACAATGYSIRNPIHRACQHQYQEMFTAVRRLLALGYRRPGLMLSEDADARTMHHWTAAFLAAQRSLPAGDRVPILITPQPGPAVLAEWLHRHEPDAVLSQSPPVPTLVSWLQAAGRKVPETCGVADLDIDPGTDLDCSGIRQNYEQVAAAAVDLVVEQIQKNERGVPPCPKVVLVEGEWVDGRTTLPRPARPAAPR